MTKLTNLLREGRRRELAQALFYRFLAADAEAEGDAATAERLNELLADEQHHVSRLTARLLELGERPDDARTPPPALPPLSEWQEEARRREAEEVAWYEEALESVSDGPTLAVLREIVASERHHHHDLAGKWMSAGPTAMDDPGRSK